MKRIIGVLLIASLLLLAGCHRLTQGEVVGKHFSPAWTNVYTTYITIGNSTMPMVNTINYPDTWSLKVRGVVNGKTVTEDFDVSKRQFDSTKIGDYFIAKKDGK